MTSFLGVPLRIGREVFGNFYVCDKDGGAPFSEDDQHMLELFAVQSALAVGYARQQHLAGEAHRKLDRVRDEFNAVIAHDLRNPVAAIVLQVDAILKRAGASGEVSVAVGNLERIRRSAERVAQMSNDLLDASRIEVGQLPLDRRAVDLAALVRGLVAQMTPTFGAHPVSLELYEELPPVWADAPRLEQVLTNLVENAIKYSPPAALVTVRVEPAEGGATVTVEDQGPGLGAEDLSRIFDRFYQAPRAREQRTGLGLGLYIAKGLVDAHGGRLWVDSEPGRGSRFHVWVPSTQAPVTQPGAEAHPH
jgi:signal transduction histidine kinase